MGQVDGAPGVEGSVDVLGERHEASLLNRSCENPGHISEIVFLIRRGGEFN